jgi:hypothetical protein
MSSAPLTEVRERLSEVVDEVIETLNILSDPDTMAAIGEGLAELDGNAPGS